MLICMDKSEFRRQRLQKLIDLKCEGVGAELARRTGIDASYVTRMLYEPGKKAKKNIGEDTVETIETSFDVPGWFDPRGTNASEPRIPVVANVQFGDEGYWQDTEHPTGHGEGFIVYPTRDKNAYALRGKGDSMRPRIKPGEYVVILPGHQIAMGDEVMVQTKNGRSMIKQLGSRRNGTVELISINENDHRPITLEESEIVKMHYVAAIVKDGLYRTMI